MNKQIFKMRKNKRLLKRKRKRKMKILFRIRVNNKKKYLIYKRKKVKRK
jgi:hypothetical protein